MTLTNWPKQPDALYNISLPALQTALNVTTMTGILGPLLSSLVCPRKAPTVTGAKLLDYKPEKRGLVLYEVAGQAGEETVIVFGKLYAERHEAIRTYKTMKLLWDEVFFDHSQLGLPHPIGCIPELSMLLYLPVEGHFLDEMLIGDQALPLLALVGLWLGTLHRRRLHLPRQFDLATELVNTRAWAALISCHYPDEAEAAAQIAGYLQKRADALPFELDVPIHKDFHYGHVIVNQKLQVIDFDEMRLGDPNFDVGHFCANLSLLACRQGNALWPFARFQRAFLDAYAGFTGWVADERLVYFYAYTCLKIAWQLCNGYGPHPRPEGKERRRQVRQMLQQGLAATLPVTTAVLLGKSALLTARLDNDRKPT